MTAAVVEDSSVYGAGDLFTVYRDHLGRPITATTATAIAQTLGDRYVADGYARPRFRISDPGTDTGVVRLVAVESSITGVRLTGDPGPYRTRLSRLMEPLVGGRVLRTAALRDAVKRARRLPGLEIGIATERDDAMDGGYILVVEAGYQPLSGSVRVSNRGTRETGRNLAFGTIAFNGVGGRPGSGSLFVATATDPDKYRSGGVFARTTLWNQDLHGQFRGSVTALAVDSSGVHVEQDRQQFAWTFSRAPATGAARDLTWWGGFDMDNLDVAHDGVEARTDRLRSLKSGLTLGWLGDQTQNLLSVDWEWGLDLLAARLDNNLDPQDRRQNQFFVTRLHYVRLMRPAARWSVRLDGYAQHSSDTLPAIKRFKVGGGRIGRGFEAAALYGDRGLGGRLEVKRLFARTFPVVGTTGLYGYYDLGAAWRDDRSGRDSASSAGIGVAIHGERLTGQLELARPLTGVDADGRRDVTLFGELAWRF